MENALLILQPKLQTFISDPEVDQAAHSPQCVRDMKCERSPISDQVAYVP